ncbi:MAG: hypothetical protein Ta2F_03360 [Termitinemataceae bacterium]|nr:MAG: hypothetical protein Ta2F_03360 [Termitinemataceae bacterium]
MGGLHTKPDLFYHISMKKLLTFALLLCINFAAFAEKLPDWVVPLRDAVYEYKTPGEVEKLARDVKKKADVRLSGFAHSLMSARLEYFTGRAYQNDGKNTIAQQHYEETIKLAEASIKEQATSEAYELIAAATLYLCQLKDDVWIMMNAANIDQYSKLALSLNGNNTNALYMVSWHWIYSNGTSADVQRGIVEMTDILNNKKNSLQKDDLFNINVSIGYAYLKQKKSAEAEQWLKKALEYYPGNKYAAGLLAVK